LEFFSELFDGCSLTTTSADIEKNNPSPYLLKVKSQTIYLTNHISVDDKKTITTQANNKIDHNIYINKKIYIIHIEKENSILPN